jgi:hypothetical protein
MLKMKSLAKNSGSMEVKASEPWYPSVTITEASMPELKGKSVGDKVKITVEACVKGVHEYGNGEIEYNLDLEKACIAGGKE